LSAVLPLPKKSKADAGFPRSFQAVRIDLIA
jgi:hypothetical protein